MDRFLEESRTVAVLEDELRKSLAHVPPPDGFTDRVMARVTERETARRRAASPRTKSAAGIPRRAWWTAAAAALVLTIGGGNALHLRHQRQEREAAAVQAQMEYALQLTNHALNEVQTGLDHSPAGRFAALWNGQ